MYLMDFTELLPLLRKGTILRRIAWLSEGKKISMICPETGQLEACCIYQFNGKRWVEWLPSQDDLLMDDWEIVL